MMNGKSKKLQQEILCGEKLSVNIFYIRVREYKSRHNLSEVQNPREMLLSHADGEKLKDSFDFSHVGAFYCSISLRIRQGQAAYGGGCHCLWFKI